MLNSILEDLLEDEDREFKTKGDGYYFASTVHYPNNKSLVKQKVYIDKDANITKTEVVDSDDNVQIVMEFTKQEYNKKFDKNYFELSELLDIDESSTKKGSETKQESNYNNEDTNNDSTNNNDSGSTNQNSTENNTDTNNSVETDDNTSINNNTNNNTNNNSNTETNNSTTSSVTEDTPSTDKTAAATIDDVIYPMYLPDNTYLTSQNTIDTDDGQRLILTFGGDTSFILVEETVKSSDDGVVIPVSGEFDFLADVIGVIGTNSLSWHSNGIDYYMASESITTAELVEIARSISVLPVSK